MNLLIIVSTPEAGEILLPLAGACRRKGIDWAVFFTNDGVKALSSKRLNRALGCAQQTVVCEHSWARFMAGQDCPQELGSQTQNSIMVSESDHIISL